MAPYHSDMLRTLDICFWFPRTERGAMLAKELRKLGHDVVIYHNQPVPYESGYVRSVPYHWWKGLQVLLSTSHDIYVTSEFMLPALQLLINKLINIKPYVIIFGSPKWEILESTNKKKLRFDNFLVLIKKILLKLIVMKADKIVCNSAYLSEKLKFIYPAVRKDVGTIYNGIDYTKFKPKNQEDWRNNNCIRIASTVTINFQKKTDGVLLLLKTFDIIFSTYPDIKYYLMVKTSVQDQLNKLYRYIEHLKCKHNIELIINTKKVNEFLNKSHLFLYATPKYSSDSLPRALIEAQAVGIPTITTNTVGCPEVVLAKISGTVVPYNTKNIANAALNIINNYNHAIELAEKGKDIVREKFNWSKMARSYEKLLGLLLDKQ